VVKSEIKPVAKPNLSVNLSVLESNVGGIIIRKSGGKSAEITYKQLKN